MARSVNPTQDLLLREPVTRPVYLIDILVDSQEYLSTHAEVEVNGNLYLESDATIENIDDWRQARIRLQPTVARTQQVLSQSWRYGYCRVYLQPTVYLPQLLDPGYVEEGYAFEGVVREEPILLVDGELTSMEKNDVIIFTVENRISIGRWLPGIRISAPTFNHLPKAGQVFTWEGERFTLEAS